MAHDESRGELGWMAFSKTLRAALSTNRHAEMLFEAVSSLLGDHVELDTAQQGKRRALFVRDDFDPSWLVPWPVLQLAVGHFLTQASPAIKIADGPEPPPRDDVAPKLRGLQRGEVAIADGRSSFHIQFRDDGLWREVAQGFLGAMPIADPRHLLAELARAIHRGGGQSVELLSERVAALDPGRLGPGRVQLPVPVPGGPQDVWNRGLHRIREALWEERVPAEARWVAVDGFDGSALGFGATRADALAAWRAEVGRWRPRPPVPEPRPELPPSSMDIVEAGPDHLHIRAAASTPRSDAPWPDPMPENTPAVLVPLARAPGRAPAETWVRLLGRYGASGFAVRRPDPDGCTLLGERALDTVDLDVVRGLIDAAETRAECPELSVPRRDDEPQYDCHVVTYRVVEDTTGPALRDRSVSMTRGFIASEFDADRLRDRVVRQRWLP